MKDKDIKEMFDNAVESDGYNYTNVSTENIQKTVMERLGKQREKNFKTSAMEEAVEPVYVTAAPKKFRISYIFIASTAAICLGVTAIATGFFGMGSNLSMLNGTISDVTEQSDLPGSAQEIIPAETPAETSAEPEKSETTAAGENTQNYTDNKLPFKNDTFTLLDGTKIVIDDREAIGYYYTDYVDKCLLSEVNGRVYFWNGKVKKDLTDLINTETPYIESYENEGSGLTHYIVIGGDVPSGKYFYAEMFQTNEREWYYASVTNNIFDDCPSTSDDENEQQWYTEMASINVNMVREAIKQVSGVPASSSGGGVTHIDFKTVTLPIPEEEGTQDHRGNKLPLKNDTFTLLDGTKIVVEDNKVTGVHDALEDDCLLSEVNGRVYFWNGEKKEDITDYIHMENTYGYAYGNDESGLTHYVIVGGDVASGKYFYAEAFQTYEREWHFYSEHNDPETFSSRAEEEQWDKEMAEISDSVILSMLNQICDKNGQERPVKYGGGGGHENFKSVTLPCDR